MEDEKGSEKEDTRDSWNLIKQGAEARIYKGEHNGKPVIIKERFSKSYRVPALDQKLTSRRMNQEVRAITRCRKNNIRAPEVYRVDNPRKIIYMECIEDSVLLKDYLKRFEGAALSSSVGTGSALNPLESPPIGVVGSSSTDHQLSGVMNSVGTVLAQLHNIDLIHGDLTTSNMFYSSDTNQITLIDFGLSFVSSSVEDKGVDLYVLERAFLSTHPNTESMFQQVLESYRSLVNNGDAIIRKLEEVRARGRKRVMVG